MADRPPLPPESPECDDSTTPSASSATSTKKSTDSDPQFKRPVPTPQSTGTIPGVEEYLTDTQKAAKDSGLSSFVRPRPAMRAESAKKAKAVPMEGKALEIAGRLKELFHAYDNRQSSDNRSAQTTMGPSEIGSPCDRRIALSLLRTPPVNSGGDGWAAFVGTCVHAGLADMFVWGNAGSGRYQVEVPLQFTSAVVPFGTTDLIDTALLVDVDHKVMGSWSLNKLRTEGPSPTYRVQAHTYAMGARLAGYDIKDVAIVGWPRERSSLDDLYVWTEPYDPGIARNAIARVERISDSLEGDDEDKLSMAYTYEIDNSDCRFCPYHLPGAARSEGGKCNGRS